MIDVSVVMGVRNGGAELAATLDSVLGQRNCTFEFIAVDDGSTDDTAAILRSRAQGDNRLRVIRQEHRGLTAALVTGCAVARGEFIARQDCGDLSLPGRLERQSELLGSREDLAMVACGVRFVGPAGEPLFISARDGAQLQHGLRVLDAQRVQGPPHHGATMFRAKAFRAAGGYREAFPVAQDLDLWLRLSELGACWGDPEVGYEARLAPGGISALRRPQQLRFAQVAVDCALMRARGEDDGPYLRGLPVQAAQGKHGGGARDRANFYYFIASCLRRSDPRAARRYYWRAFREHPLLLKGLLRATLTDLF